jgi:hypothetical protein
MADGIDACTYFVACLTVKYILKVNRVRENPMKDNCAKEFNYAMVRGKPIIPLILEHAALDSKKWPPGIVSFYANHFHMRATDDDWNAYSNMIRDVTQMSMVYSLPKLPQRLAPIYDDKERRTPRQSVRLWNCKIKPAIKPFLH